MKVIAVDNFAREYVSDFVVKENVTKEEGEKLANDHNSKMHDHSPWFHKLVEDDHELNIFNPNE